MLVVVINLICVPKKEIFFLHFSGSLGGVETHKNF